MSDVAIRVENLSKRFVLGERIGIKTFRETLQDLFTAPFRRWVKNNGDVPQEKVDTDKVIWALKDVSFEVKHGEVLGIIGPNGAGKSTLLKILSRITEPTGGYAEIRGRVGSLLEVGTGFHPELTGRENIYLNGAILGMSKAEIRRKFDDIVSFAGVEKFIDTPVKRYSSGMQVRLAFAVAAHLEPEILIIDEVLAVGDAEFQKRCLGKMDEVSRSGRTVLFVSHNMAAIKALCRRAILLQAGRKLFDDSAPLVVNRYLLTGAQSAAYQRTWTWNEAPGNENIRVLHIGVYPGIGDVVDVASGFVVRIIFYNFRVGTNIDTTIELRTIDGIRIFHEGYQFSRSLDSRRGFYEATFRVPGYLLNAGVYWLKLIFGEHCRYLLFKMEPAICFEIHHKADELSRLNVKPGILRLRLDYSARYLGDGHPETINFHSPSAT
jgi:lipopolysaccharide transport system ATP-binding protein